MKKPAQVFMLPTNEKADIVLKKNNELLILPTGHIGTNPSKLTQPQHLYILSDEEIKEGDWVYCLREGFEPVLKQKVNPIGVNNDKLFKKIIATTDKSIILPERFPSFTYLPQPSQSFLEKFVEEYNKGNVITEVMVEYEWNKTGRKIRKLYVFDHILKINPDNTIDINMPKDSWSREEVIELIQKYSKECTGWSWFETDEKWIEENL